MIIRKTEDKFEALKNILMKYYKTKRVTLTS